MKSTEVLNSQRGFITRTLKSTHTCACNYTHAYVHIIHACSCIRKIESATKWHGRLYCENALFNLLSMSPLVFLVGRVIAQDATNGQTHTLPQLHTYYTCIHIVLCLKPLHILHIVATTSPNAHAQYGQNSKESRELGRCLVYRFDLQCTL